MPKKFAGENSKAVVARARKAAAKEAEVVKKQKALEDEYWKDDDKHVQRKQQRKEDKERKRQEQLDKKAVSKSLAEEEMNCLATKVSRARITRAQVQSELDRKKEPAGPEKEPETHLTKPLEENLNRAPVEEVAAHSVDDAIALLDPKAQRSSESARSAFTAFEAAALPRLKQENPTLRLSQLKQLLRKEWMRSTENPVNQRLYQP